MHGHGGLWLLVLLLIVLPGLATVGLVRRSTSGSKDGKRGGKGDGGKPARGGRGGGISGWLAYRRKLHLERVKDENARARDEVRHRQRLLEQEERDRRADKRAERWGTRPAGRGSRPGRTGGGPDDPDPGRGRDRGSRPSSPEDGDDDPSSPSPWRARVVRVWPNAPEWSPWTDGSGRFRLPFRRPAITPGSPAPGAPDVPAVPGRLPATTGSPDLPGTDRPQITEPPARGGEPLAPVTRPAPGQVQPDRSTIEGVIVTTPAVAARGVPGVEQTVEGMRAVHEHARAGNIRAKRRALLALAHICRTGNMMAAALARVLAEPNQHYGPEVTDPISEGAMYMTAAASAFSQGDDALKALLNSSLDESMRGGRTVPHHEELTDA